MIFRIIERLKKCKLPEEIVLITPNKKKIKYLKKFLEF